MMGNRVTQSAALHAHGVELLPVLRPGRAGLRGHADDRADDRRPAGRRRRDRRRSQNIVIGRRNITTRTVPVTGLPLAGCIAAAALANNAAAQAVATDLCTQHYAQFIHPRRWRALRPSARGFPVAAGDRHRRMQQSSAGTIDAAQTWRSMERHSSALRANCGLLAARCPKHVTRCSRSTAAWAGSSPVRRAAASVTSTPSSRGDGGGADRLRGGAAAAAAAGAATSHPAGSADGAHDCLQRCCLPSTTRGSTTSACGPRRRTSRSATRSVACRWHLASWRS